MISYTIIPGTVFVILFLICRIRKNGFAALIFKTSASLFFIFTALIAVYETDNFEYGVFIISALLFGLIGDILLDLKWMYPENRKNYLISGFASFLLGHLLFLTTLLLFYNFSTKVLMYAAGISIMVVLLIILGEKPMKLQYDNYLFLNIFYGFVLTFVTSLSGFLTFGKNPLLFSALFLFLLSDMILAITYFGKNKNTAPFIISNHLLYYGAQYLIAVSILFYKV